MDPSKNQFDLLDGSILCFGAYGNGNLGDALQANALYHEVKRFLPERRIIACTAFNADYPFAGDGKMPGGIMRSPEALRRLALLMIGGGGLLSHRHIPLEEPAWAKSLPVPCCFVSVGAHLQVAASCADLIRRAAYVGARDEISLFSLLPVRGDIDFMPDPVLISETLTPIREPSPLTAHDGPKAWILRASLDSPWPELEARLGKDDAVILVEPKLEAEYAASFKNRHLVRSLDELENVLAPYDTVVAARFHGAIVALKLGKRTYGYRTEKITSLFRLLGLERYCGVYVRDLDFGLPWPSQEVAACLALLRKRFHLSLETCLVRAGLFPNRLAHHPAYPTRAD